MKRISFFLLGAICLVIPCLAQDNAARTAAEREAAEERYKLLNSAVEGLTTAQADLQRRMAALADEIRSLRSENTKVDTSKFVTREDYNRLAKAIDEIEQKREADKRLIRDEFEQLKKDIVKLLNAPSPPSSSRRSKSTEPPERGAEKLTERSSEKSDKPADAGASAQEGVKYTIEKGNTLSAIVRAHNDQFKSQGKKTTVDLVLKANPGLDSKKLQIGQTIFIPLVSE